MKLYQSLFAAALLLSRIEASFTIDNVQEKTDSDTPTVRIVRVHSPTMEERGNGPDIINEISVLTDKLAIELGTFQKHLKSSEKIVEDDREIKNLPEHARPIGTKLGSATDVRWWEMHIAVEKLQIDYNNRRQYLLNAIGQNEFTLENYHEQDGILMGDLDYDLRIIFAKSRYDVDCINRKDQFEKLREEIKSLALDGPRTSLDLLMDACTKLQIPPIDPNEKVSAEIFETSQYRVLYEFAERLARKKIDVSGSDQLYLITSAAANLMKKMLRRLNYRVDQIPESKNDVAFATLAEFRILRSDENALKTKKLL
ncbi:hypothetical protein Plhal304r1_c009g0037391 [Plasmopara halstedii]